jgi:hypothetical protein
LKRFLGHPSPPFRVRLWAQEASAFSCSSISSRPRLSRSVSLRTPETNPHTRASVSSARRFLCREHRRGAPAGIAGAGVGACSARGTEVGGQREQREDLQLRLALLGARRGRDDLPRCEHSLSRDAESGTGTPIHCSRGTSSLFLTLGYVYLSSLIRTSRECEWRRFGLSTRQSPYFIDFVWEELYLVEHLISSQLLDLLETLRLYGRAQHQHRDAGGCQSQLSD